MKNIFKLMVFGCFALVLTSCGGSADSEIRVIRIEDAVGIDELFSQRNNADKNALSSELVLNKLERVVRESGFNGNEDFIIRDATEWSLFWSDYLSASRLSDPLPQVDFSRNTVIVTQRISSCDQVDYITTIRNIFDGVQSQTQVLVIGDSVNFDHLDRDCGNPSKKYWTVHAVSLANENLTRDLFVDNSQGISTTD